MVEVQDCACLVTFWFVKDVSIRFAISPCHVCAMCPIHGVEVVTPAVCGGYGIITAGTFTFHHTVAVHEGVDMQVFTKCVGTVTPENIQWSLNV